MSSDAMNNHSSRVVVVGAGHAGAAAALNLRRHGFHGEIVVLSEEADYPYDRPPLSKSLFNRAGGGTLAPEGAFTDRQIDLRLGVAADSLDVDARVVALTDGTRLPYTAVILATGARPRQIDFGGSHEGRIGSLRTLDDARQLEAALDPGGRLAVVGGGWIGLEVASAAKASGRVATVIEREDRLLARVASRQLSSFLTELHLRCGVDIITGRTVTGVGFGDGSDELQLDDGQRIGFDHMLVAVGAIAEDTIARAAGLACEPAGVVVDDDGRTSHPDVFAIGDAACRSMPSSGRSARLESIPSALEQARRVAARIMGQASPPSEVPWFWSTQHDLHIQIAGFPDTEDEVVVVGHLGASGGAICHVRDGRLACVEAVNAATTFNAARAAIASGESFDPDALDLARAGTARRPPGTTLDVTFILPDGQERSVGAEAGKSVMEAGRGAQVPGIVAECGGSCSCGTCHVYVDEAWREALEPPTQDELEMLEYVDDLEDGSRLACQIMMSSSLAGLAVRVAQNE